jgi:hypothetical protein
MTLYRTWYRSSERHPTPERCFYCNKPLDPKHVEHSVETGKYQVNYEGEIGCKKCFMPQRREEIRDLKAQKKKLKGSRKNMVPMYVVDLGKPKIKVTLTRGKLKKLT